MLRMFLTLDVSKLSGWLNADAYCRAERRACDVNAMRGEERAGRLEVAGDGGTSSVQGWARLQVAGRARGGAHAEHIAHVGDAGGVEAQRLVELPRILPRAGRRRTMRGEVRAEVRAGGAGGGGRPRARSVQGRSLLQFGGKTSG